MPGSINLNIETLILVAIWKNPFIFQGIYTVTNSQTNTKMYLFFRCECFFSDQRDLVEMDFFPEDYHFTHLYNKELPINVDYEADEAWYLLKFALKETLKKMLESRATYPVFADEIATQQITHYIQSRFDLVSSRDTENSEIGFAVSIDFIPKDAIAKQAALALMRLIQNESSVSNRHLH